MQEVTVSQITEKLERLSPEKLNVVYDFISYLLDREADQKESEASETFQTMLASENILKRDWERVEEDEAWGNL